MALRMDEAEAAAYDFGRLVKVCASEANSGPQLCSSCKTVLLFFSPGWLYLLSVGTSCICCFAERWAMPRYALVSTGFDPCKFT